MPSGTYKCYVFQTTQGPRHLYTFDGERVHSADIPLRVFNSLRCKVKAQTTAQPGRKVIKVSEQVPGLSPSPLRSSRYNKSKQCLASRSDTKPLMTVNEQGKCYITDKELNQYIKFISSGKLNVRPPQFVNDILTRIASPCDKIARFMPGACIKGWRVIRKLGQGAFGAVFMAERAGELAALKIVVDSPNNNTFVPIEQEVRMQQAFADAGLAPRIFCHAKTRIGANTVHMILMEPVDFTLNALLCRDVVTRETLKEIGMSLFRVLLKMRKLNVTHGDMHTENIAFRQQPDGTYKMLLIDFGQSSLRVNKPVVDAEQLLSDLVELEEASPKVIRYITRVLTFFLQRVAGEQRALKGTREEFFKRHRSYEPYMGI